MSAFFRSTGCHELGTRKREANFAFTYDEVKATQNQKYIEKKGYAGAYFAKKKVEMRTAKVTLHGLAWRSYRRVVLLTTTRADIGSFRFHIVKSKSTQRRREQVVHNEDNQEEV